MGVNHNVLFDNASLAGCCPEKSFWAVQSDDRSEGGLHGLCARK